MSTTLTQSAIDGRHRRWLCAGPSLAALFAVALCAATQAQAELPEFRSLVRNNQDSVVNISTTQKVKTGFAGMLPGMPDDAFPEGSPFEEFFRQFRSMPRAVPHGLPRERESRSLGSGFIISADGKILTNAHVVDGAESIVVKLADNSEKPARLIGLDKATDVALLKIDASRLPAVHLGDSARLEVGDWVLTIGSPFGLEHTATQGIVSAVGRTLPDDSYVPFIQTDVAVNPGNSGGPLFNTAGEVVGINSQIYSRTGGYMGLSFAIPINTARDVVRQLETTGKVARGWLGIGIQNVNGELAKSFGLDKPAGALVSQVDEKGPAAGAGLRAGDVILEYNGHGISQSADLPHLVGETAPGSPAALKIWRNGAPLLVRLNVARLKPAKGEEHVAANGPADEARGVLNLQVAPLNDEQREQAGIEKGGVLVVGVADGPAARAGIQPGDILLRVGSQAINSPRELAELAKNLPHGKPTAVLVQRDEGRLFLPLTIPG